MLLSFVKISAEKKSYCFIGVNEFTIHACTVKLYEFFERK
jgi:hypothetical protein